MDAYGSEQETREFLCTCCLVFVPALCYLIDLCAVTRRLSGGLEGLETAGRRGCAGAGPFHCAFIDDTIKLLNDDAALELFVCIIVALVAVVSCVCKTHFSVLTLLMNTRLLRRFRRAGCSSGREWPLLPKGTALGCCAGDEQRGPRCCKSGEWKHTLKTHVRFSVHFSKFRSTPQVWTAAAALRLGAAVRRHHRCCRSLCHRQACKTRLQLIFFPSHRDKCTFVCFCGSSFLSPGETAAAAARRLGCCALVVQHGHHCCRSPSGELARHT